MEGSISVAEVRALDIPELRAVVLILLLPSIF
jgi:hypothetical protein